MTSPRDATEEPPYLTPLHSEVEKIIGQIMKRDGDTTHLDWLALANRCSQIIKGFEERIATGELSAPSASAGRDEIIEECAKEVERSLYEADEAFLEKRGDEERIPYETGQAAIRQMAAAIRALKNAAPQEKQPDESVQHPGLVPDAVGLLSGGEVPAVAAPGNSERRRDDKHSGETPRTNRLVQSMLYNGELVPSKLADHADQLERELAAALDSRRRAKAALGELKEELNSMTQRVLFLEDERKAAQSATVPPDFAARCRPAVKSYLTRAEQSLLKVGTTFAEHYRPIMEQDANEARALLDEIDALIDGSASTGREKA